MSYPCGQQKPVVSRRDFLSEIGGGFGAMALGGMIARDARAATRSPNTRSKAKAVIQIFCPGGLSQVDTWDHKPELTKRTGEPFDQDGKLQFFASKPGNCRGSFWPFREHGQSGKAISVLFPHMASMVDDIAFVHSMHNKSG